MPILTIPRRQAPELPLEGCWPGLDFAFFHPPQWRERADIEDDENYLQAIPYVVLQNPAGALWCYARQGGDARLDGRRSCGVGGHVESLDAAPTAGQTLLNAARRELAEELGLDTRQLPPLLPQGLVYEGHSAIGRVHLGILFVANWPGAAPTPPAHEALTSIGFLRPEEIAQDARFECWSHLAAKFISKTNQP